MIFLMLVGIQVQTVCFSPTTYLYFLLDASS